MYSLQVKLLELRTANPKTLRLYKKQSDMNMFPGSTMIQNQSDLNKYGISERRTGINFPINRAEHEVLDKSTFDNLESDDRYSAPDFISNQTTLKYLMAPTKGPMLFKATRCATGNAIDICVSMVNWTADGYGAGYVMEQMLCTAPETECANRLYGQFFSSLGSKANSDTPITMAFTAQLDGLEYTEEREQRLKRDDFNFTKEDLGSVVEIKSINRNKFYPRYSTDEYYFEQTLLRQYWAQCQLTGISNMIVGVVGPDEDDSVDLKLQEIWTYDVNRLTQILKTAKESSETWKRPFPQSIFTTSEISKVQPSAEFETWTKNDCLQEFHAALSTVKNHMWDSAAGDVMYFIYQNNLMIPAPKFYNQELRRINYSIKLWVTRVDGGNISTASARDTILQTLRHMASDDPRLNFLTAWSQEKSNIKLPRFKSSNHIIVKLMFESEEDANTVLHAWNAMEWNNLNIVASWATYVATLNIILREISYRYQTYG